MDLKKQFYALLDDLKTDFTPEQQQKYANLFDQCQNEIRSGELKAAAVTMGKLEKVLNNDH